MDISPSRDHFVSTPRAQAIAFWRCMALLGPRSSDRYRLDKYAGLVRVAVTATPPPLRFLYPKLEGYCSRVLNLYTSSISLSWMFATSVLGRLTGIPLDDITFNRVPLKSHGDHSDRFKELCDSFEVVRDSVRPDGGLSTLARSTVPKHLKR